MQCPFVPCRWPRLRVNSIHPIVTGLGKDDVLDRFRNTVCLPHAQRHDAWLLYMFWDWVQDTRPDREVDADAGALMQEL